MAASPPELTILRQQYDKAYAERVTAVHEATIGTLNTKFATALDNAIAAAKSSGDLPTVLAIQEDKKAIEAKQDLPPDTDTTPAALKTLRAIYREQLAKLAEQRTANATALLTPYAAKLQALEATLTKADRVDEAKEVMDYRVGLKADAPPQPPAMAANLAKPTAPASPPAGTAAPQVKGDDRKAAEWVIGLGGSVALKQPKVNIFSVADLPKGKFEVLGIRFLNFEGKIPEIPDDAWSVVAGLQFLDYVNCDRVKLGTPLFEHLSTCTAIRDIQIQDSLLDDGVWPYLARMPKVKKLALNFNGRIKGVGMSQAKLPELETLGMSNHEITDLALLEIASFKSLKELNLDGAQVTDEGIGVLAALPKLTTLNVIHTPVSAEGLAKLKTCAITRLGFGRNLAEMVTQMPDVAAVFPKLEHLFLPRESNPTTEQMQVVSRAFPELIAIDCRTRNCDDGGAAAIAQLPKLETLELPYAPITDAGIASIAAIKRLATLRLPDAKITDAALETLAGMKALKKVKLPKPGNGITADGLAKFKKKRPDVTVE